LLFKELFPEYIVCSDLVQVLGDRSKKKELVVLHEAADTKDELVWKSGEHDGLQMMGKILCFLLC